jgi:hypothetical protein
MEKAKNVSNSKKKTENVVPVEVIKAYAGGSRSTAPLILYPQH